MRKGISLLLVVILLVCAVSLTVIRTGADVGANSPNDWTDDFSGDTSALYTSYGRWWNNAVSTFTQEDYSGVLGNEGGPLPGWTYYYLNNRQYGNFEMEFDVTAKSSAQYGVVLRAGNPGDGADDGNGYTVMYDGSWAFVGIINGKFTQITKTSGSYAYNPKSHGIIPTHWKVVCVDDTVKLYFNHSSTVALTVTDSTYTSGQIGFRAFAPTNSKSNVLIDNLVIRDLSGGSITPPPAEEVIGTDPENMNDIWSDDFGKNTGAEYTAYGLWWNNAVSDMTQTDYSGVLGNEGGSVDGYTYYYLNRFTFTDLDMEFDVTAKRNAQYGVVLRAGNPSPETDEGDCYTVMYDGVWAFVGKMDGAFTQITKTTGSYAYNPAAHGITPIHWRVLCTGSKISVYFNHATTPAITVSDTTFTAGKIGFRTFAKKGVAENVLIDNLVIRGIATEDPQIPEPPAEEEDPPQYETTDFSWNDSFSGRTGDYYLVYGRWWNDCYSPFTQEQYNDILANEGGDVDGYCYYYLKKYQWTDFTMEFDVPATASPKTTYGVMLRAANPSPDTDAGDGYTIMYDGDWVFCATLDGNFKQIKTGQNAYNPSEHGIEIRHWKIICNGHDIKVYFNESETPAIAFTDNTYTAGYVGLRTFAPKETVGNIIIDNLSIAGKVLKSTGTTSAFSNRGVGTVHDYYTILPTQKKTDKVRSLPTKTGKSVQKQSESAGKSSPKTGEKTDDTAYRIFAATILLAGVGLFVSNKELTELKNR